MNRGGPSAAILRAELLARPGPLPTLRRACGVNVRVRIVPAVLALMLAGAAHFASVSTVRAEHADEVDVVAVTIDRFATLSQARGVMWVTGTLTCSAAGHAEFTWTEGRQRSVRGTDNFDLWYMPCSTQPTRFATAVENFDNEWKPGTATVRMTNVSQGLLAERRVTVKASK